MLRPVLVRLLALLICVGLVTALFGYPAEVVSYDKGKLTVKADGKEKVLEVGKGSKFLDADGKGIKGKDLPDKLKAGTKVEITEKDGKFEIKLK
jgi:hypothetical protein